VLLGAAGLACAAVVIAAAAASQYQPLGYGSSGSSIEAFPGIPAGQGIRPVNNLGRFHEDIYIPPQRRVFSLFADIRNNGTHPVTIVSVKLLDSPFALAGPVRYSTPGMGGSDQSPPPESRVLHDVVLGPGQEMFVGFPVRMWPCAANDGWESIQDFNVTFRYSVFTHTVAVPWGPQGDSLLVRSPGGKPGQKGVICAPGTTRANLPKVPAQQRQPRALAGTIIRISKARDIGELRLTEMTAPDAAAPDAGTSLPACFLQDPPLGSHRPGYRVVNFDLNWGDINLGQRGTAPAERVTIAGPDGVPMVAAVPQGPAYDTVACRTVRSFLLGRETTGWQFVLGLTLRVPLSGSLTHLLVTAGGHTITVPLVPVCGARTASADCFDGSSLGGPWTSGTRYSVSLRT
jgi:hypothetical protein